MKKKVIIIITLICFTLSIAYNIAFAKKDMFGDLLLQNIELLSNGESEQKICAMDGTLDCPGARVKVRFVW